MDDATICKFVCDDSIDCKFISLECKLDPYGVKGEWYREGEDTPVEEIEFLCSFDSECKQPPFNDNGDWDCSDKCNCTHSCKVPPVGNKFIGCSS